ncbi:hypothetical protein MPSEU_000310600 [Mayamaea pseudoterrestris]|nr:hypothetical protein MPSEU_000310600 [Mayamaea pseudoterrestris]
MSESNELQRKLDLNLLLAEFPTLNINDDPRETESPTSDTGKSSSTESLAEYAKEDDDDIDINETPGIGDFVEITSKKDEEKYQGIYGYIEAKTKKGFRVALDTCETADYRTIDNESLVIGADDMMVIRKHKKHEFLPIWAFRSLTVACYGAMTKDYVDGESVDLFDSDLAAGILPRPLIKSLPLPPLDSPLFSFEDDAQKHLYLLFWTGQYTVLFSHHFHDETGKACIAMPSNQVLMMAVEDSVTKKSAGIISFHYDIKRKGTHATLTISTHLYNGTVWAMTTEQNSALQARTAHLLVRSAGCSLGFRNVCALAACAIQWYEDNGRHDEKNDVLIAVADIAILTGQSDVCVGLCFRKVIMGLNDLQAYDMIIGVSQQVLDDYACGADMVWFTRAIGVGHLLNGESERASEALWLAMQLYFEHFGRKVTKNELFQDLATDMTHLYYRKKQNGKLATESMDVPVLLGACCETAFQMGMARNTLEPAATKFHFRNDAKKALFAALATAAAFVCEKERDNQFLASVLQWKGKDFLSGYFTDLHLFLSIVRDAYTSSFENVGLAMLTYCAQPCQNPTCEGCETAKLKCTRCKQAWYCCKDCQVSHWKDHKSGCAKGKKE